MKKIYSLSIALLSITFVMGLTSCKGGGGAKGAAAAVAGRAAMEIIEEFDDEEESGGGSSNVSFKGKKCRGIVGCDCSGFKPITDGDVWQQAYCKKCGHERRYHR